MATSLATPAPVEIPVATPEVTPQPAPAPLGTQQTQDRNAVYEKYYGSPQPEAPPEPEPTAQVEPPSPEAAPTEPAPEGLPPAPEDDRVSKLEQQITQLTSLLSQLASPVATGTSTTDPIAPEETQDWIDLLRQGKRDEAEQVLFKKFLDKATQESTTQALELFRVETEINEFVKDLRRENPDLVPFEKFIGYNAQVALEASIASGKIRNTKDYMSHYKDAVNTAVKEARTMFQQVRAAEQANAQVIKREVLSTMPAPVNTQDSNRGVPPKAAAPVMETAADYVKMRQHQAERRSGMFNNS